jgi:hexosaminidase
MVKMSITTRILSLLLLASLTLAIWPIPVSYTAGNTTLWIKPDVQIILNGTLQVGSLTLRQYLSVFDFRTNANVLDDQSNLNTNYGDHKLPSLAIVEMAIGRAKKTLFKHNFVPWKFHPRNSEFEPAPGTGEAVKSITLTLNGPVDAANVLKPLAGGVDESYTLCVPLSGAAEITANSAVGLSHGLTTFTQLFYKHSTDNHVYTRFAPVDITDTPKFQHRGINMDVARNYFPVADIKRQIEAASYVKMNRFHIHITDGQSWPLEVPALPELSAKGAYRKDLVYTPDDVRDLQVYGAMRGVQVFIEIDMPGHTSSIHFSHPELIASFNKQPNWQIYAAEPPSGTLKLNHPAVPTFLEKLFADLLPRLAPYTAYFHTGGDEVNDNAYLYDETVASNDSAVLQPLMQKFVDRNHDQLRAAGFTPIVWQEMLLQWNVTLGKDVVVQTWRSDEAVLDTVTKGHKALVGNYNYWVHYSILRPMHPFDVSGSTKLMKHTVPRLRLRCLAQLPTRHLLYQRLPLQRLLHPSQVLAPHLLPRPTLWHPAPSHPPRPRR